MICKNFHISNAQNLKDATQSADRFLVTKFLTPQRWDIVVFSPPEDPSTTFGMRLIGLPGEEIEIRDRSVWANQNRLDPPEAIAGITYISKLDIPGRPIQWGSAETPAKLGENEYFVLGDFSTQSNDSRMWQRGSPGHPPYAVPQSHLKGVVTHIYWPPSRWRAFP
jgi:signal peptidase I